MCLQFASFDFGVGMLIQADTFIRIFKSPDKLFRTSDSSRHVTLDK